MRGKTPRPQLPEVEELSDLQWARVERGLWTRLDAADPAAEVLLPGSPRATSASWRLRGLVIGALAVAAVALLAVLWRGWGGLGREQELAELESPSRVMTRESATTVSFAEAAIEVAPRSAMLLSGDATRGATVVLERGRAGFRVAPRKRPFMVVAGNAMVRVVGTHFQVAREGEHVEVEVHEGKVSVHYLGHVHQVASGEQWRSANVAPVQTTLLDDAAATPTSSEAAAGQPERAADPAGAPTVDP
ncbi:MAG TPA: FecR family protein, partial [Kofleriaceae bacterium]|nr:FecR family protein [Kofleriaceae bacterium]